MIEAICTEEIGEILMAILCQGGTLTHEDLNAKAAKLLGYRTAGTHFEQRAADAISSLELDNRIDDLGESIRSLETSDQ